MGKLLAGKPGCGELTQPARPLGWAVLGKLEVRRREAEKVLHKEEDRLASSVQEVGLEYVAPRLEPQQKALEQG